MENREYRDIEYCVYDPTGNITALVTSAVDITNQPAVASRIMEQEPAVEQVGFVSFAGSPAAGSAVDIADQPAVASRIMEQESAVEQVGFVSFAGSPAVGSDRPAAADSDGPAEAAAGLAVDIADQPAVASRIMEQEPAVEQVGFVSFAGSPAAGSGEPAEAATGSDGPAEAAAVGEESVAGTDGVPVSLRMAGGEFCGNATMCAAALYLLKEAADKAGSAADSTAGPQQVGEEAGAQQVSEEAGPQQVSEEAGAQQVSEEAGAQQVSEEVGPQQVSEEVGAPGRPLGRAAARTVSVKVSGAAAPLTVALRSLGANGFASSVTMPPAMGIETLKVKDGMLSESNSLDLPVVRMEGIAHIIIEPDSGFFGLKDDPALAERLLRDWCGALSAECLGMMFLDDAASGGTRGMIPLVYVPGADTMFWENSCASGSAAAGIYLAAKTGKAVDVTFDEPAGRLRVESDPAAGRTILHGTVRLVKSARFHNK